MCVPLCVSVYLFFSSACVDACLTAGQVIQRGVRQQMVGTMEVPFRRDSSVPDAHTKQPYLNHTWKCVYARDCVQLQKSAFLIFAQVLVFVIIVNL